MTYLNKLLDLLPARRYEKRVAERCIGVSEAERRAAVRQAEAILAGALR